MYLRRYASDPLEEQRKNTFQMTQIILQTAIGIMNELFFKSIHFCIHKIYTAKLSVSSSSVERLHFSRVTRPGVDSH